MKRAATDLIVIIVLTLTTLASTAAMAQLAPPPAPGAQQGPNWKRIEMDNGAVMGVHVYQRTIPSSVRVMIWTDDTGRGEFDLRHNPLVRGQDVSLNCLNHTMFMISGGRPQFVAIPPRSVGAEIERFACKNIH
jgi:hypothetical protein